MDPEMKNSKPQDPLGSVASEVTQAKRHLQRAARSAEKELKIRARDRGEATNGRVANSVIMELEHLEKLIQNFQLSFGLKDEETGK